MKRTALQILIVLFTILPVCAFGQGKSKNNKDDDKQRWMAELRNYKHSFLVKELSLTQEEQNKFFPVYDEMDDELTRISSETRDLEQKALSNDNATETELSAAAFALYQQKKREGEVETIYYEKLKDVITPIQLIRLKNAERKFTQQLLRRHGRIKANGKK